MEKLYRCSIVNNMKKLLCFDKSCGIELYLVKILCGQPANRTELFLKRNYACRENRKAFGELKFYLIVQPFKT